MPKLFQQLRSRCPSLIMLTRQYVYGIRRVFESGLADIHLKFGGEFRFLQVNEHNLASPDGAFTFDGSVTGVDFADFLLGAPKNQGGYQQAALQLLDSARAMVLPMHKTHGR